MYGFSDRDGVFCTAFRTVFPGGGSLGFVADVLAWLGRTEVMQNYWVRRLLAALGAVLLIAFMVTTTASGASH